MYTQGSDGASKGRCRVDGQITTRHARCTHVHVVTGTHPPCTAGPIGRYSKSAHHDTTECSCFGGRARREALSCSRGHNT